MPNVPLKNVAETVSALESSKIAPGTDKCMIDASVLAKYIPKEEPNLLPAVTSPYQDSAENPGEREAIIRMLFQLKQDVDYLKQVVAKAGLSSAQVSSVPVISGPEAQDALAAGQAWQQPVAPEEISEDPEEQSIEDEPLSIEASNLDLIERVLRKHGGNRKEAAEELGISERTLYRKIKMIRK